MAAITSALTSSRNGTLPSSPGFPTPAPGSCNSSFWPPIRRRQRNCIHYSYLALVEARVNSLFVPLKLIIAVLYLPGLLRTKRQQVIGISRQNKALRRVYIASLSTCDLVLHLLTVRDGRCYRSFEATRCALYVREPRARSCSNPTWRQPRVPPPTQLPHAQSDMVSMARITD